NFADESHQQSEQLGEQNNSALENLIRVNLRSKFVQRFERAIRFDMHRAQPRNFRVGQRERARNERTKTDVAHECRQLRTQLLTNEEGRLGFCLGRFVFPRLINNETLGEIPHLWSGSAHLEMCSHGALFREASCLRPTTGGSLEIRASFFPMFWRESTNPTQPATMALRGIES